MIDTVILTVPRENFVSLTGGSTSPWELHSKSGQFEKLVKNQTSQQKRDGIYRPRIRIIKRGKTIFLQVEFSVPKLLYGNNVDEVCESDFEAIVERLRERLLDFGIAIETKPIRKAIVSVFHPSKNIVLKDGYTSSGVIKELGKINLTRKLDLNRDSFRNEGQSLQCYSNAHSLVIYDKIQDLLKPKGRAVDKDKTPIQTSLFEELTKKRDPLEILRIEVRLSKKAKMREVLSSIGYENAHTFESIFKKEICQKIVQLYWDKILKDNVFLFDLSNNPKQILKRLQQTFPNIRPKEAIYLSGLCLLCRDDDGIRDLRVVLKVPPRTWYRLANDIKKLNTVQSSKLHGWIQQVHNVIKSFEPYRIRGP